MFARIMAVVMAAILITAVCLSAIWWFTLRNQQIDARLEYLISEAEDMAFLAGEYTEWTPVSYLDRISSTVLFLISMKAKKVYEEFGGYIAIVDRAGNIMDNLQSAYSEDPDFFNSLSETDIAEALRTILKGENIRIRSAGVGQDPTFTVGVPVVLEGYVSGAVFIQTRAQRIESGLEETLLKIILIAAAVLALSGIVVFLFVRSSLYPLRGMITAAGRIAEGDFSQRVEENRGSQELRKVCQAFNTMTKKLEGVEEGRKEFVANVSHELRSPITSIRGFAEGMADGVIPEEEHPKYLRLVVDESKRLSALVNDLLALSRLERDDAKPDWSVFDINEILRTAIIRRIPDMEAKKIDIACEPETDPCMVRADRDRIEQVVINLLDNAIKFTGENGKITLDSRVRGKTAEITVSDDGIGVDPADREKIFDRFFTVDRAHTAGKGTGLGLSICQRIIEMHGQSLRLLDTEKGASFRFTLEYSGDESRNNLTETEKNA